VQNKQARRKREKSRKNEQTPITGVSTTYIKTKNMWTRSHSIVTTEATKEQMWKLFSDINHWHVWNKEIEFALLEGKFEAGNQYLIQPKNGRTVSVKLVEVVENKYCWELGEFPMAKMYYYHMLDETADGLKITSTITMKGLLSFLWIQLVVKKIAATMASHVQEQIHVASGL
jgi:hypothetical protein